MVARFGEQLGEEQRLEMLVRQELSGFRKKLDDINERLKFLPPYDEQTIERLNEETAGLNNQLNGIYHQISQLQAENPHVRRLNLALAREPEVRSRTWSDVKCRPSPEMRAQLAREAEAVMRAEAAVACVRKQEQVQREAQDLARFHLNRTPRVVLDDKATNVMLEECAGPRPKHEIAGIVLDMAEQRHIQIAK
jgi:hypothetical protein